MLLAKALTHSLPDVPGWDLNAEGALDLDSLSALGFPGKLAVGGVHQPGTTQCVCIGPGGGESGYPGDLLIAFDDYERFADSREIPSEKEILSPVLPAEQSLAPFRIAAYPEERYLFTRGNLPLPCPKCGRIVHAVGRGPVSSMSEYFEYECCHPFYYFRPFREWAFDKAVYDPATNTLFHHGHRYARQEFLVRMFEDFRRNLAVCLRGIFQGRETRKQQLPNDTIPVLFGRGEFNPGHIIFEDLAGAFLLCEAMDASGVDGRLDILVSEKARWYEPLLKILPGHRVARVTRTPSDSADITSWLCGRGLPLVNPKVHPCWPHTINGCRYLEKMCARITGLSGRKISDSGSNAMRVVFVIRTHNRCWEPLFENVQQVIGYIERHYIPAHFVLHAVGTNDSACEPFRNLAARRKNVTLLFDAPLLDVLSQYGAADLCVGPIGSGFWWAGLFGVPSVTIHPENRPDTVEQGEWILPPPKGRCSPFLAVELGQRCVAVEEKNANRETYGALRAPVDKVLRAVDEILRPTLKRTTPNHNHNAALSGTAIN
ncbi:hypothetical protein [Desulfosarcina alkanivorans]|uniref:hypothetical protein n=1 Tax=Desulfosarcina alkanivorans TaxID=571177 RepID=UPI0012D35FE8|nr:hypothetical protein [Desulfosarcina alkanivorans]